MQTAIASLEQARDIATQWAELHNANVAQVLPAAEVWFDAGKDDGADTPAALRAYLANRFKR